MNKRLLEFIVRVESQMEEFERELKQARISVQQLDAMRAAVPIVLENFEQMVAELRTIRQAVESLDGKQIDVSLEVDGIVQALGEIENLLRELNRVDRAQASAAVDINGTADILAELRLITSAVNSLDRKRIRIPAEVTGTEKAIAEIGLLQTAKDNLTGSGGISIPTDNETLLLLLLLSGVLTPLAPLVSGLVLQLASLGDIIGTSLVGAVASATGGLTLFAGGLTLLTFSFMKALKNSKALRDEFSGFTEDIKAEITDLAAGLTPIFIKIAKSINDQYGQAIANAIGRSFEYMQRGLEDFYSRLSNTSQVAVFTQMMNRIASNSGKAISLAGSLILTIINVLNAALPAGERFLNWLTTTFGKWQEFTSSAEGQNTLTTYFNNAADTAARLWGVIVDLAVGISGLMGALRESGMTEILFTQIEGLARGFRDFTAEGSKGRDMIVQFAKDIQPGMDAAWRLIGAIVVEWVRLSQKVATARNEMGQLILPKFFDDIRRALPELGTLLFTSFAQIGVQIPKLLENVFQLLNTVIGSGLGGELVGMLNNLLETFNNLPGPIKTALAAAVIFNSIFERGGLIGVGLFIAQITGLLGVFNKLPGPIKTALITAAGVGILFKGLAGGPIAGLLGSLVGLNKKGLEPVDKEMANKDTDSKKASGAFDRIKKTVSGVLPTLTLFVTAMGGKVRGALGKLGPIIARVGGWLKGFGPMFTRIGGFIARALPWIGRFIAGFARFGAIRVAIQGLIAIFGVIVGAISAPVLIIIGVIAGLIAIGIAVWKNWDTIGPALASAWQWIKDKASVIWNSIKQFFSDLWSGIKERWSAAWNGIKTFLSGAWTSIKATAQSVWRPIGAFFSSVWNSIKNVARTAWNAIKVVLITALGLIIMYYRKQVQEFKSLFGPIWNSIKNGARTAWNGIKAVLMSIWNGIKGAARTVWNGIKNAILAVWRPFSGAMRAIWAATKGALVGAWNALKGAARASWNGIKSQILMAWRLVKPGIMTVWNGIRGALTAGWNALKGAARAAWNGIKAGILAVWRPIKGPIMAVVNGIKSGVTAAWNAIKRVSTAIWTGVKNGITVVWNAIKNVVKGGSGTVRSTITAAWNFVKNNTKTAWNTIKSYITQAWNAIKNGVRTAVNTVRGAVTSAWNSVRSNTIATWNAVKSYLSQAWNAIKNGVRMGASAVLNAVKAMGSSIMSTVKGWVNSLYQLGVSIIQGLINGIKSMAGAVSGAIGDLLKQAYETGKAAIKPGSPSRVYTALSSTIPQGLAQGIIRNARLVTNSMRGVMAQVSRAAKSGSLYGVGQRMSQDLASGMMNDLRLVQTASAMLARSAMLDLKSLAMQMPSIRGPQMQMPNNPMNMPNQSASPLTVQQSTSRIIVEFRGPGAENLNPDTISDMVASKVRNGRRRGPR